MCHFQEEAFITSVMEAWADKEVPLHQNSLKVDQRIKKSKPQKTSCEQELNLILFGVLLFFFLPEAPRYNDATSSCLF